MIFLLLNILLVFNGTDELRNSIDNYLKKNLSGYSAYEFQIIKQPDNYAGITIDESGLFTLNGNLATIPVKVKYKDNPVQQNHLIVKVKLFREVFVANRQISRNEILSLADFRVEVKEVTQLRGTAVESTFDLSKMISKSSIQTGAVLIYELFQAAPVIISGDKVTAQSYVGNVMITTEVYSRQDGAPGETIKIQTKDKKQFRARVLNSENVLIIE